MKAANSVSKMALAHDIAVDDDFHLEKVELPSGRLSFYTNLKFKVRKIMFVFSLASKKRSKRLHTKPFGIY